MKVHLTPLRGLVVIETAPVCDDRGRFVRVSGDDELAGVRPGLHFSQINVSTTHRRGTIRGMHFQYPPAADAKLIRCLRGSVFDVAVDLRIGSPTFLHWHAFELNSEFDKQVFIPEGFAHGFQTLSDDAQLLYMHTAAWSRDHDGRLRHDDPMLSINWPLVVTQISDLDRSAPLLDPGFLGVQA